MCLTSAAAHASALLAPVDGQIITPSSSDRFVAGVGMRPWPWIVYVLSRPVRAGAILDGPAGANRFVWDHRVMTNTADGSGTLAPEGGVYQYSQCVPGARRYWTVGAWEWPIVALADSRTLVCDTRVPPGPGAARIVISPRRSISRHEAVSVSVRATLGRIKSADLLVDGWYADWRDRCSTCRLSARAPRLGWRGRFVRVEVVVTFTRPDLDRPGATVETRRTVRSRLAVRGRP